jgi:hypothetical protein
MSTMREHLGNFHKAEASHHAHKATHHKTIASHCQKLASSLGKTEVTEAQKDSAGALEAMATMHEVTSQKHAAHAEFHRNCAEKCDKAVDAADLNKLVPMEISVVAPTRPTIAAVLRPGMREMPTTSVPTELAKILGDGDEFQNYEEPSLQQRH